MHTSGVLYFVSTTINPLLYHIMSRKFRKAFKVRTVSTGCLEICEKLKNSFQTTFSDFCGCGAESKIRHYTTIRKLPPAMRNMQRSVSDGVTQVNKNFLGYARGRTALPSEIPGNPKGSHHARISFLSNETRSSSMYEKNKSYASQGKGSPVDLNFLPAGFRDAFRGGRPGRTNLETDNCDSANTISNSSLRDTDMTEFNYSDLVNDMMQINRNIS